MKKILLSAALVAATMGFSQTYDNDTYYLNELITSPPNTDNDFDNFSTSPLLDETTHEVDNSLEYFEFRGEPNTAIAAGTYFIALDSEGSATEYGEVTEVIDLGGMTFGSNGLLVIVANTTAGADLTADDPSSTTDPVATITIPAGTTWTNPYFPDAASVAASEANVVVIELNATSIAFKEQTDVNRGSGDGQVAEGEGIELDKLDTDRNAIGYDGTFQDNGATYMLISATGDDIPTRDDDVSAGTNGVLDGKALNWTIYDSVSILDADGGVAFGQIVFTRTASGTTTDPLISANVVEFDQEPQWYGRQNNSTGYAASKDGDNDNDDWFGGRINSRSYPAYDFSSTDARHIPENLADVLEDFPISTYGGENPSFGSLASTDDVLASALSVYPNPASGIVTITSSDAALTSVTLYNTVGTVVYASDDASSIDVSSFAKGVYFLKLNAEGASTTKKLIVE